MGSRSAYSTIPLCFSTFAERPVAVLPTSHPLAQRSSLQMADLAGESLHRKPSDPSEMQSISTLMHLIALGRKVAVLPGF